MRGPLPSPRPTWEMKTLSSKACLDYGNWRLVSFKRIVTWLKLVFDTQGNSTYSKTCGVREAAGFSQVVHEGAGGKLMTQKKQDYSFGTSNLLQCISVETVSISRMVASEPTIRQRPKHCLDVLSSIASRKENMFMFHGQRRGMLYGISIAIVPDTGRGERTS